MVGAMIARDHRPEPRTKPEPATAQFGNRVVPEADKTPLVRGVFAAETTDAAEITATQGTEK